jgi:hypothetical protein
MMETRSLYQLRRVVLPPYLPDSYGFVNVYSRQLLGSLHVWEGNDFDGNFV